jgi:hypothetical protein
VKILRIALISIAVSACSSEALRDGYQPGDGLDMATDGVQRLNRAIDDYCNRNADDPTRQAALLLIRLRYPDIPADGICTKFEVAP